jgi:hypothetical protein
MALFGVKKEFYGYAVDGGNPLVQLGRFKGSGSATPSDLGI